MTTTLAKPRIITIHDKKHLVVDITAMKLFCQLLNHARHLKNVTGYGKGTRRLYLAGMLTAILFNLDSIKAGENIKDYRKHVDCHAYNNNGGNDW